MKSHIAVAWVLGVTGVAMFVTGLVRTMRKPSEADEVLTIPGKHVITQAEAEEVALVMELAKSQSELTLLAGEYFPIFQNAITKLYPDHVKNTKDNIEVLRDRIAKWRKRVEEGKP